MIRLAESSLLRPPHFPKCSAVYRYYWLRDATQTSRALRMPDFIGRPAPGLTGWLAPWLDALLLLARRMEARRLFERLLRLPNDVGLLSQQYDPRTRRMLGNFPQAFSCVALVNSACNLTAAERLDSTARATRTHEPGQFRAPAETSW
jgi:GH15 family glucan-1,4-alpha-glucosidase